MKQHQPPPIVPNDPAEMKNLLRRYQELVRKLGEHARVIRKILELLDTVDCYIDHLRQSLLSDLPVQSVTDPRSVIENLAWQQARPGMTASVRINGGPSFELSPRLADLFRLLASHPGDGHEDGLAGYRSHVWLAGELGRLKGTIVTGRQLASSLHNLRQTLAHWGLPAGLVESSKAKDGARLRILRHVARAEFADQQVAPARPCHEP